MFKTVQGTLLIVQSPKQAPKTLSSKVDMMIVRTLNPKRPPTRARGSTGGAWESRSGPEGSRSGPEREQQDEMVVSAGAKRREINQRKGPSHPKFGVSIYMLIASYSAFPTPLFVVGESISCCSNHQALFESIDPVIHETRHSRGLLGAVVSLVILLYCSSV